MSHSFLTLPTELQLEILMEVNSISTMRTLNTIPYFKPLVESIVAIFSVQFKNKKPYQSLIDKRLSKEVYVINYDSLKPLFAPAACDDDEPDWSDLLAIISLKANQKHYITFEVHAYQDESFVPSNYNIPFKNQEMFRYQPPIKTLQENISQVLRLDLCCINLHFDFYEDLDSFLLGETGQLKATTPLKHAFWPWRSEQSVRRYFMDLAQSMFMLHPLDFYNETPVYTALSKELMFKTRQHFRFKTGNDSDIGFIKEPFDIESFCTFPSSPAVCEEWLETRAISDVMLNHLFELVKMDAANGTSTALEYLQRTVPHHMPSLSVSSDLVLILPPGRDRLCANIQKQRKIQNPGLSLLNSVRSHIFNESGNSFRVGPERVLIRYKRPKKHQTDIIIKEKSTQFEPNLRTLNKFFTEIGSWSKEFAFEQQIFVGSCEISKYFSFENISKIIKYHHIVEINWRAGLEEISIYRRRYNPLIFHPDVPYDIKQLEEKYPSKKDIIASRLNPMIANNFLLASMLYGSQSESYEGKVDFVRINFTNDRYDMLENIVKELTEYHQMASLVLLKMRSKQLSKQTNRVQ
ncbi:hypothetical protein WICPIJ_006547 [Wickerhamomyces pijperi]|uniref:Uncharacterized protein n=1 Tax=Wickerhamomyces pijperi TaxID=599730 RepID=A0A9P8TK46_WICPI|nr:hypothetical protein WICPIJ_006547 [Wickerhamomyces pijperi]